MISSNETGIKFKNILYGAIFTATTSVIFIAIFIWLIGVGDLKIALRNFNFIFILEFLSLAFLNYTIRAIRWSYFSKSIGIKIPLINNVLIYFSGFAFTITPGKIGEIIRLWLIKRGFGYSFSRTFPLIIGDRFFDLLCLTVIMIIFSSYPILDSQIITILVLTFFVIQILFILNKNFLYLVISKSNCLMKFFPKFIDGAKKTAKNYKHINSLNVYLWAIPLSLLGWLAEVLILYLIVERMGGVIDFPQAAFIFTASTILGALTMIPGGLLGSDITMTGLLVYFGINQEMALAVTLLVRVATLWNAVILGIITMPFSWYISKK